MSAIHFSSLFSWHLVLVPVTLAICFLVHQAICRVLPSRLDPHHRPKSAERLVQAQVDGLGESVKGTDVIFVHGLGSNPDTTWTARENPSAEPVNWVTDLLPQELDIELRRTTRVFFFNYDSNWRRDALRFRLKHISDGLLSSLRELGERNAAKSPRGAVIVAHSYGGLVVKQMVADAARRNPRVLKSIKGVVFLGCPHRGSTMAKAGRKVAALLKPFNANTAVFHELGSDGLPLHDLHEAYVRATSRIDAAQVNFYEQRMARILPFYSTLIVTEQSATFDGDDRIALPVDHYGLNKYTSAKAPGYSTVREKIVKVLENLQDDRVNVDTARHVVPFKLVSTFVERRDLSEQLRTVIQERQPTKDLAYGLTVVGAGGTGKTQLVLKYVEDNAQAYDAVLWLNAQTEQTMRASFRACCNALNLPVASETSAEVPDLSYTAEVQTLLQWLGFRSLPGQEWLVVIDNADDLSWGMAKIIPSGPKGTVIVTSRDRYSSELLGHQSQRISVDCMSLDESTTLLLRGSNPRTPQSADETQKALAEDIVLELGMLPLAVDIAATYIRTRCADAVTNAMRQYLVDYHAHRDALLRMDVCKGLTVYDKTIWTVWDTSLKAVAASEFGDLAAKLLTFLTLFDRTSIQEHLFECAGLGFACEGGCGACPRGLGLPDWLRQLLRLDSAGRWDAFDYRQATALLVRYGLVRQAREPVRSVTIHALVHWRAEKEREGDGWGLWHLIFMAAACHHLNPTDRGPGRVPLARDVLAHIPTSKDIQATLQPAKARDGHVVWHNLGVHLWRRGRFTWARVCLLKAVTAGTSWYGFVHREVCESLTCLAWVNGKLNRWPRAIRQQESAVNICLVTLGERHLNTFYNKAILSHMYHRDGEFECALGLLQDVVLHSTNTLGRGHVFTTVSRSSLAWLYVEVGRLQDAEHLARELCEAARNIEEPESLESLEHATKLAVILYRRGRVEEAERLLRETQVQYVDALGSTHDITLWSKFLLAEFLVGQARFQEALKFRKEVLKARQMLYGPDHPETVEAQIELAACLWYCREKQEAQDALNETLLIVAGMPSPESYSYLTCVAMAYLDQITHAVEVGDELSY